MDALGGKEVISGQAHSLFWILDGSSLLGFVFPDGSGFVQFELRVDPWASWECIGCFEYGDTSILDQSKNIDHSIFFCN